ncbi:MAG TPA: lysine 2,3-aminomutase, partial [Clostridiaceae bacterium]|nr:lysine 2,3-aminomutase [Clostridiaceae bacterium]
MNQFTEKNRREMFPEVPDEKWNSWLWQVQNRIETVEELKNYLPLTVEEEAGARRATKTLRMAITPYYLTLMDQENHLDPVRLQAVPSAMEIMNSKADLLDPLH